jgi:hypothetical protein
MKLEVGEGTEAKIAHKSTVIQITFTSGNITES